MQPVPGTHQERACPLSPPTLGLNFCEDALSLSTHEIILRLGQGGFSAGDRPQKWTGTSESCWYRRPLGSLFVVNNHLFLLILFCMSSCIILYRSSINQTRSYCIRKSGLKQKVGWMIHQRSVSIWNIQWECNSAQHKQENLPRPSGGFMGLNRLVGLSGRHLPRVNDLYFWSHSPHPFWGPFRLSCTSLQSFRCLLGFEHQGAQSKSGDWTMEMDLQKVAKDDETLLAEK